MIIINLNLFKKYDVALSFAEENRTMVDLVAKQLREQDINVYYDDDFRITSWGKDLKENLDKVYRLQARFCVVFVSKDYELKRWTRFEIDRAKARSLFVKKEAYVLPYLLDDSGYAEQFKDVICITRKTHNEHQLVNTILEKLNRQPSRRLLLWLKSLYGIKQRLFILIALLAASVTFYLKDNLMPVDYLTKILFNRNTRHIKGSICEDDSLSFSRGQGSCSHHGGVKREVDTVLHVKTMEQCRSEAERISWWQP